MATTTTPGAHARAPRATAGPVLTLALTVLATATLGALLPAAVASWTSGAPAAVQPVSVRLDGSLSTAGLPSAPAVSLLTLHNDGGDPIRWTVEQRVVGVAPGAATIEVWVAQSRSCETTGVLLQPGRWSATPLAAGAELPLCVRITDHGASTGGVEARPTVSVHARTA